MQGDGEGSSDGLFRKVITVDPVELKQSCLLQELEIEMGIESLEVRLIESQV